MQTLQALVIVFFATVRFRVEREIPKPGLSYCFPHLDNIFRNIFAGMFAPLRLEDGKLGTAYFLRPRS